jgi:hypothetical protein
MQHTIKTHNQGLVKSWTRKVSKILTWKINSTGNKIFQENVYLNANS